MEKVKKLTTLEEIKTFSDPYRLKILKCMLECDQPMTVKQMGVALGEKPSKVHYHVQKLLGVNILTLDHTETIHGIIAKYYQPTAENFVIEMEDDVKKSVNKQDVEDLFGGVLDVAKESFAAQVIKAEAYKKHHQIDELSEDLKVKGGIALDSILVSDEELEEIIKFVTDRLEKYKTCKKEEGKKVYQLLFGYMEEFDKE